MATVAWVLHALAGLDPTTEVRLMRVERRGEFSEFALTEIDDVHVEHDASSGRPVGAWLVAGHPSGVTEDAAPQTWPVRRSACGCVIPVAVNTGSTVSTLAVRCPHYEPSRVAIQVAGVGVLS